MDGRLHQEISGSKATGSHTCSKTDLDRRVNIYMVDMIIDVL